VLLEDETVPNEILESWSGELGVSRFFGFVDPIGGDVEGFAVFQATEMTKLFEEHFYYIDTELEVSFSCFELEFQGTFVFCSVNCSEQMNHDNENN